MQKVVPDEYALVERSDVDKTRSYQCELLDFQGGDSHSLFLVHCDAGSRLELLWTGEVSSLHLQM